MNEQREDRPLVSEPRYGSPDSPYLVADEAWRYLRFGSRKSLYNRILPERIPHRRRGRMFLFLVSELDRWLLENTRGTQDRAGGERRHAPTLVKNAAVRSR